MARASTITLLPLDTWAAIMGLSPYWFNQISEGFPTVDTAQCEHVFRQFSWQGDFLSREEVARCIRMAETMIANQLHFYPAPQYIVNERQDYPRNYGRVRGLDGLNANWQNKAVQLDWHKVQGGGTLSRTLIKIDGAVVLSDSDGDSINDTFTVTVPTTVSDAFEVAVYFTEADRLGAAITEGWRVRPVRVQLSGGNAIISGPIYLIVKPILENGLNPAELNINTAGNFAATLEVYQLCRSDAAQGFAVWETYCSDQPCDVQYTPLCIGARNADIGFVSINYNLEGVTCPGPEPDRVIINYLAGEPLVNGEMNPDYADIVAHLATALLPGNSCGCARADRIVAYWREVPPAGGEGLRSDLVGDFTVNPFGPQRGAVYAWNRVIERRQL